MATSSDPSPNLTLHILRPGEDPRASIRLHPTEPEEWSYPRTSTSRFSSTILPIGNSPRFDCIGVSQGKQRKCACIPIGVLPPTVQEKRSPPKVLAKWLFTSWSCLRTTSGKKRR